MVQFHDEYQIKDSFWDPETFFHIFRLTSFKRMYWWLPIVWTEIIYVKNYWKGSSFSCVPLLNLNETRNNFFDLGRGYASIFHYLFNL